MTTGGDYNDDDDNDGWLVESTPVDSDCNDFGSRAHHQDKFLNALFYNYTTCFLTRVKELVTVITASKNTDSMELLSSKHMTSLFLKNRQTWHPRNHHQQVEWLNSLCLV